MLKEKKSFVLRMDKGLFDALEKWAADEFRSMNGQLEWIITNALRKENRLKNRTEKATKTKRETPVIDE